MYKHIFVSMQLLHCVCFMIEFHITFAGFNIENCTGVPQFHTLLTLTLNFVHYSSEELALIPKILKDINEAYPKIKVIVALPQSFDDKSLKLNDTTLIKFETR